MNKIKYFIIAAVMAVSCSAFAQFSNANYNQRNTHATVGSKGFDGNSSKPGYKGFVEVGYAVGVGDYGEDRVGVSTSHGYQFNPYIFAGAGVGANYFSDSELWGMPLFADVRVNLLKKRVSPILNVKLGYSVFDIQGFYFSPSVGCRVGFSNNTAIFVSIGYELQMAEFSFDYYRNYGGYYDYYSDFSRENCGGSTFKVGFEF